MQNLLKLRSGVCDLLESLPDVAHMRHPLLHYISNHLSVGVTANWFGVSSSTVKAAHVLSTDNLDASLLFVERFVADIMCVKKDIIYVIIMKL